MSLPVGILAGGLASRLRPATDAIPKSLVEVDGRPFVEHQLDLLRGRGVDEVVLLVGHLGEMIQVALGDGRRFGVRLRYVFDGPRLLGTGGAVRRALPVLGPAFFILYGDSYLDCNYQAIERAFVASGKRGLMTVFRNDNQWDRSNVVYADGKLLHYNKQLFTPEMSYIDYGLGAFQASAFEEYSLESPFDLADVYRRLLADDELAGFEVTDRFYEIGSPAGLEATRAHLAAKRVSP